MTCRYVGQSVTSRTNDDAGRLRTRRPCTLQDQDSTVNACLEARAVIHGTLDGLDGEARAEGGRLEVNSVSAGMIC